MYRWRASARRLALMADNCAAVIALEWLAAAQGVDFLLPHEPAPKLADAVRRLRNRVPTMPEDRFFGPDIAAAKQMLVDGALDGLVDEALVESRA
jgi:histidine ammonia-lyase